MKTIKTPMLRHSIIRLTGFLTLSCLFLSVNAQDLANAIKLTKSEQFEAAAKIYSDLIKKEPAVSENYYYFGENYLKLWLTDSASTDFNQVSGPALELFKKGIEVNPSNPFNYVGVGTVNLFLGDSAAANIQFTKARSFLPFVPKKSKLISPPKQAEVLMKIAEAYIISSINDSSKTLPLLRRAIYIDNKNPEICIATGDAYLEINDGSNAMLYYKKAYTIDSKYPISYIKIGNLYKRTKAYKDALTYFENAVLVDSSYTPGYRELAELYALAGRFTDALKTYDKFFKLSANNLTAKVSYSKFLYMAKDYQGAIKLINEIMQSDSSFNILNRIMAYCYYETNQPDLGLTYINKFLTNAPLNKIIASDYAYYGRLLIKIKNDTLAVTQLVKSYNMDTSANDLLKEIASCYNRLNKFNDAAKYYEIIVAKSKSPGNLFNLGRAFYNGKNYVKADSIFKKMITDQPNSIQAYRYLALSNVGIDSTTTLGLAKPYYEKLVSLALIDSVKYIKEILEAYDYQRFYHLKQFNLNKKRDDAATCAVYCEKILAINPKDENSKAILKSLKGKY